MALKLFKCNQCGETFQTKKAAPTHCEGATVEQVLTVPATAFYEKTDAEKGKSALVGQEKILRERARRHSRDVETDDLIQMNLREDAERNGWVNKDGKRRKAIDDL